LGLSLGLFLLIIMVFLCRKYLKFPLDNAEARRILYPVTGKRSHPAPQYFWHPALNVTMQSNGYGDDERVEQSLHTERGYYTTEEGQVKIFWQSYRPKRLENVTHALVMLHGYADHCDFTVRQQAMTSATLNNTWVFTLDYPGHGRSDGLWAFIEDWAVLIAQIAEVVEIFFLPQIRAIGKPMFCWGTSQGGAVAIHLCMSHPNLFEGAVLLCPMCDIAKDVRPTECAVRCLVCASRFAGRLPVIPSEDLSLLLFEDHIIIENLGNSNKLDYRGKPRLATGRELLRAATEIISRSANEMTTPFLLIHGDNDRICPIEQSKEFYKTAAVEDKMFEEIPGAWHLVLEYDIERTFQVIFDWINQRLCKYTILVD